MYGYDQLRKYGESMAMEAVWKLNRALEKSELQAGYKWDDVTITTMTLQAKHQESKIYAICSVTVQEKQVKPKAYLT